MFQDLPVYCFAYLSPVIYKETPMVDRRNEHFLPPHMYAAFHRQSALEKLQAAPLFALERYLQIAGKQGLKNKIHFISFGKSERNLQIAKKQGLKRSVPQVKLKNHQYTDNFKSAGIKLCLWKKFLTKEK